MKGQSASPAIIVVAALVLILVVGGLWWLNFGRGGGSAGPGPQNTGQAPVIGAPGTPPLPGMNPPPPAGSR
jgi:hypothetical protein